MHRTLSVEVYPLLILSPMAGCSATKTRIKNKGCSGKRFTLKHVSLSQNKILFSVETWCAAISIASYYGLSFSLVNHELQAPRTGLCVYAGV